MARTNSSEKSGERGTDTGADAIALLKADHAAVHKLFTTYNKLCAAKDGDEGEKGELAARICNELTVHATIEEEIFYPALRDALDDPAIMDEAEVEHASAKELISQLEQMEPGDELYDAKVIVLGEYIDHHVKEEEGEMFQQARKAKLDIQALGDDMRSRQQELKAEVGLADDDADEKPAKSGLKGGHAPNGNRRAA